MTAPQGMPRIAVASCHDIRNYGSMLQAYATQRFLEGCGYEVRTIDKRGLSSAIGGGRRAYYRHNALNVPMYLEKVPRVAKMARERLDRRLREGTTLRNAAFDRFAAERFKLTRQAFSFDELGELSREYDSVAVGSDQNWLPVNISGGYYTLEWVDPSVRRVSMATSFGVSDLDDVCLERARGFLSCFDAVSVREESGADIVEQATGKRPEVICDPTMLLSKGQWSEVADLGYRPVDDAYIFCYFLGRNRWQREAVRAYADRHGLKVVAVTQIDSYQSYDETFADVTPWDVGPDRWLSLVANASLVCTDSFHGTVFSNVFGVPFVTFRRHAGGSMSTNSRLDTLLGRLGEQNRICESPQDLERIASLGAPAQESALALEDYGESSARWVREALGSESRFPATRAIAMAHKEECCGCGACAQACPVGCVAMAYDDEGCEYPDIGTERCVGCGRCARACPVINQKPEVERPQRAFLVQHRDPQVLLESTSGGAMTALAQAVLAEGGIVFGAGYLDEAQRRRASDAPGRLVVGHFGVEREDDLWRFRNSKYVQSVVGPSYREVQDELAHGREVLFIGTPCQCEGLLSFLGTRPPALRVADVVCHAAVCRAAFSSYVRWLDSSVGKADDLRFRDKSRYGYNYSNLRATARRGDGGQRELYRAGVESDPYLRAFFSNLNDRPICYQCPFKKRYRESDLTCWDCFDVAKFGSVLDDNRGVTRVLVQSDAGQGLLDRAGAYLRVEEIDADAAVVGVREMVLPVATNPRRPEFMRDVATLDPSDLVRKWTPDSAVVKAERLARGIAQRTGAYDRIKRTAKRMLGR